MALFKIFCRKCRKEFLMEVKKRDDASKCIFCQATTINIYTTAPEYQDEDFDEEENTKDES